MNSKGLTVNLPAMTTTFSSATLMHKSVGANILIVTDYMHTNDEQAYKKIGFR